MKENIENFVLAVISFLTVLVIYIGYFYILKIIWLNIFSIWGMLLTSEQLSALSFLTMIIINSINQRGVKKWAKLN